METISIIADMVRESERHADTLSKDRLRAIEYYQGEMKDTPSDTGRSKMVTRDVRTSIKKVLPSLMRTLLNADEVVEFQPVSEDDEEGAAQSTDYVNHIILAEAGARDAIHDALHDALLLRNGILKWWHDERKTVKISKHTGLTDDAFAQLASDDDVEVLEHSEYEDTVEQESQETPVLLHDAKIRKTSMDKKILCSAVPRERFLIHPDAVSLEDSLVVGEKTSIRRGDLVAMGYDRDMVSKLSIADADDTERDARRDVDGDTSEAEMANELIDYYDLYIRIDKDGDGIAELRHMCFSGGLAETNLLEDDEVDDVQYCDVSVMEQPHQWEGISLADDLMDLQRTKTVLLRQTLDNLYWQNNPQPSVQEGVIVDMDAVLNPEFGLPIRFKQGTDVRTALNYSTVPFVAQESFGMMEYLDQEASNRTGVSDASAGLAPDALQNMTATASSMIEQAAIGQTELMVKTAASGLRNFFRGLLRLTIRHQDVPRTVRLRDEWVEVDPRHWNAEMDCTVNTGLGAGTRERDMAMMTNILALQEKIIAGFGEDNPFVKPDNLHNTISKMVEAAGLKTPSLYFTKPDEKEVKAAFEAAKNAPNPEEMKLEAQAKLEQAKMQSLMQLEQAKLEADNQKSQMQAEVARDKEAAQMEADLQTNAANAEREAISRREQLQADLLSDREKRAHEEHMKRMELGSKFRLEALKTVGAGVDEITANADEIEGGADVENMNDVIAARPDPNEAILNSINSLAEAMALSAQAANAPKQVVRDESGNITGIAPVN